MTLGNSFHFQFIPLFHYCQLRPAAQCKWPSRNIHPARDDKKAGYATYIRTGRRHKSGEVTIKEIRRTNDYDRPIARHFWCLWQKRADDISILIVVPLVGRLAACHKTIRTKELRRCMIRVRDERMKMGGGREEFKDVRRFTKVLEGQ